MNNIEFENIIGYSFRDKSLLDKALTHSSFCRESNSSCNCSNERLEYLGDAYLDAVIGLCLYEKLESKGEGQLSTTRAQIVCEKSLSKIGKRLRIGEFLNMGKGEIQLGGRNRESIIADAMEALIGAIFLDSGYEETERFIIREFEDTIEEAINGKLFRDYKTKFQEAMQKKAMSQKFSYVVDKEEGPDHNKLFYISLVCGNRILGQGVGRSKKEAEQEAARIAIERYIDVL